MTWPQPRRAPRLSKPLSSPRSPGGHLTPRCPPQRLSSQQLAPERPFHTPPSHSHQRLPQAPRLSGSSTALGDPPCSRTPVLGQSPTACPPSPLTPAANPPSQGLPSRPLHTPPGGGRQAAPCPSRGPPPGPTPCGVQRPAGDQCPPCSLRTPCTPPREAHLPTCSGGVWGWRGPVPRSQGRAQGRGPCLAPQPSVSTGLLCRGHDQPLRGTKGSPPI